MGVNAIMPFTLGNKLWDNPKSIQTRFQKGQARYAHWTGKKFSDAHRLAISLSAKKSLVGKWMKGKRNSPNTEFKSGRDPKKHWNWKGGITPVHHSVFK